MLPPALRAYAQADVYLLDQILRGRIQAGMRVLDVACGGGRNMAALLELGCLVSAVDHDPQAIDYCRQQFGTHPHCEQLLVQDVASMSFAEPFDVVIINALFHFAANQNIFRIWADSCWKQLKPGGLWFARLSTKLALPNARPPGFTFLASHADIIACEQDWAAQRVDPLKTTLVENLRCMSTWVLKKS